MGRRSKQHIQCPCGESSDAYTEYPDGHGHCYSCNKHFLGNDQEVILEETENAEYKFFGHRSISEQTFAFYNVYTQFIADQPTKVGFIYPNNAIKFRSYEKKEFFSEGPMAEAGLFGKDKFDPGSKESITITEGEYDALAVYEITRGNTAAVSVRSASSGKRDATTDYEYLNSFRKIILAFDNDSVGQEAARSVASLFDFGKVYHVKLTRHKDANDYLKADEAEEFYQAWSNARRYSPDNIISSMSEFAASLKQTREDVLATYPHEGLQNALYGLHRGEVVLFKGPEGIGKTEIMRLLEHHVLKTTKLNIGILHFEEDNGTTLKALAGYELNLPATLADSGVSDIDVLKSLSKLGGDDGRINVHSSFDVEDENALLDNIRYLVSAAGCSIIFLDHISWLATGQEDDDERKRLDRISQKFKLLAKELKFCLVEISHVNDDGKTRGSRNISKVADKVINLERDIKSSDPDVRATLFLTIEKGRGARDTGPVDPFIFDRGTGKLGQRDYNSTIKMPDVNKIVVPKKVVDDIPF